MVHQGWFLTEIKLEAEQMLEERIQSFQLKDVTDGAVIEPTTQAAETENTFVDGRKISDILIIAIKLWKENEESIIEKFQFDLKVNLRISTKLYGPHFSNVQFLSKWK